jgi:hypothetical protein
MTSASIAAVFSRVIKANHRRRSTLSHTLSRTAAGLWEPEGPEGSVLTFYTTYESQRVPRTPQRVQPLGIYTGAVG